MKQITIYDLLPLLKNGWVAMDADGKWNWHPNLPTRYQGVFGSMLSRVELYRAFNIALFDGSWKDSLINVEDYQKDTNKLADSKSENRVYKKEEE